MKTFADHHAKNGKMGGLGTRWKAAERSRQEGLSKSSGFGGMIENPGFSSMVMPKGHRFREFHEMRQNWLDRQWPEVSTVKEAYRSIHAGTNHIPETPKPLSPMASVWAVLSEWRCTKPPAIYKCHRNSICTTPHMLERTIDPRLRTRSVEWVRPPSSGEPPNSAMI